jgi:uncharacterized protein YegL
MTNSDFSVESPTNYEQKSICCFVVDVSGSMEGDPIDMLNQGLQDFHRDISNDSTLANRLEVAIVEFNDRIAVMQQPSIAENFTMPFLKTKGTTRLVDGVREALSLVGLRKDWYKQTGQPYLRPWVILITDGAPDAGQDIAGLSKEIREGVDKKRFVFLSLGVGNADMSVLTNISHPTMPPLLLKGLKFADFFKWVSASMSIVTGSSEGDSVSLPPPTWMNSFRI